MIRRVKEWLRLRRKWSFCGAAVIVLAVHVLCNSPAEWDSAAVLFALGVIMMFDCMNTRPDGEAAPAPAWILLAAAVVMSGFSWAQIPLFHQLLLLLFITAAVTRAVGLSGALLLLPSCAVLLIVLPFRSSLMLYLSYPLRIVSTVLAGNIIRLFDESVVWSRTTVMLSDAHIAITDACSGIAQVEAMLLLAYLFIRREHRSMVWRVLHYLFLLPAIVLANAVRIAATAWLYGRVGDAVFRETPHTILGYIQVVLTLAVFMAAAFLLPRSRGGKEAEQ